MKVFDQVSTHAALAASLLVIGSAAQLWAAPTGLQDIRSGARIGSGAIAKVEGFRSAKFGMSSDKVMKAIFKDFRGVKRSVTTKIHPTERTKSLLLDVTDLVPDSGKAQIAYIFGFKSQKLSQINILWKNTDTEQGKTLGVVKTANLLRSLFLKKGFAKDKFIANRRLKDGSIIVFRGEDRKGRMVLLFLNNPLGTPEQAKTRSDKEKAKLAKKITLMLSYMETPKKSDIFKLKDSDF